MQARNEHLHIRATEQVKSLLTRAALAKNMSVSQFILQTTVPIAEEIVRNDVGEVETHFRLDADAWARFTAALDAPPREIPELRDLLRTKAPWEQ